MDPGKKTIVHVDDAHLWREFVKKMLGNDYSVISYSDCSSALNQIKGGGVDLVILDHLLPGSGPFALGIDLCAHLKKTHPQLPVIIYTGAWLGVDQVDRHELQKQTQATVVFKDMRDPALDNLRARIRENLEARPSTSGAH